MSERRRPRDPDAAAAFSAFLAWPAPAAGVPPAGRSPVTSVLPSVILAVVVCVVIGALSFVAPLVASSGHGWSAGVRLLLFCHLP